MHIFTPAPGKVGLPTNRCDNRYMNRPTALFSVTLALVIQCWAASPLFAADWPRLGGPGGSGVSPETGLARAWPGSGPRVLWTVDVAQGFAGPAVRDGEVFLLDRPSDERDVLRCLDLNTGRELWTFAYDAPGTLPYNGSRNVPTVDPERIFMMGPFGHFHCLDRKTHQVIWAKHLVNDFKDPEVDRTEPSRNRSETLARTQLPMWGMTQAPLLYRDWVIVAPQTQKIGLIACEKATGKIRWQSAYIGRNWYSHVSPSLTTLCGVEQILMLAQPSDPEKSPSQAPPATVTSIEPETGRILWTTTTPAPDKIPIPQPLRLSEDKLLITGGYGLGCVILQVRHTADRWETEVVKRNKEVAGHIHSPVLYRDRVYVTSFKEHGAVRTGLVCLDLEGAPLWQTGPALQFDQGSFLIADGLAFIMHGKNGQLHLLELAETAPKHLAQAAVLNAPKGMVWAPMALSQGKLLVRDQSQMKCLDVRTP